MSFMVTEGGGQSFSENGDKISNLDHGAVSNQLHLKPCSSSQGLDKKLVLRRIRHHKTLTKVKSAFDSLLHSSRPDDTASSQLQSTGLQQDDAFSAP